MKILNLFIINGNTGEIIKENRITDNKSLNEALKLILEDNPDYIEEMAKFSMDNLVKMRANLEERNKLLANTVEYATVINVERDDKNAISVLRAHFERAFKGIRLSAFTPAFQKYYKKLKKKAPKPMEFCKEVPVGIIDDVKD